MYPRCIEARAEVFNHGIFRHVFRLCQIIWSLILRFSPLHDPLVTCQSPLGCMLFDERESIGKRVEFKDPTQRIRKIVANHPAKRIASRSWELQSSSKVVA